MPASVPVFDIGDTVVVTGTWTDLSGNPADPAGVRIRFKDPSGNVETRIYQTHPEVQKVSTGIYKLEISADEAGYWHYKFDSNSGNYDGASEDSFSVRTSQFS